MTDLQSRELEDRPLELRPLPDRIRQARERQALEHATLKPLADTRISAQCAASRVALDMLENSHRRLADDTDLDLVAFSESSAIWLLSGRCLGLMEAMWILVNAGVRSEAMATARGIHEAVRVLSAIMFDGDDLLRKWLTDEGRHRYVKAKDARDAEARFEDELIEAMAKQGTPEFIRSTERTEDMYDRLSQGAHNRRSSCINSVTEGTREMAYGPHPSPIYRGDAVQWASLLTVEVAQVVGEALSCFYGPDFFKEQVRPSIDGIEAIIESHPLDERLVDGSIDP